MSRINTQADRLLRGAEGFERQRTFLVQPERFASRQSNTADALIRALGQTAGTISSARIEGERREQALRAEEDKVLYNSTISNLEVTQKQVEANPEDKDLQKKYAQSLQAAYNSFDATSDNGVAIRRSFPIPDQLKETARKSVESSRKAVQGGYVNTASILATTYESEQEIARLGVYGLDEATSIAYREILDSYSPTDRENMSEETRLQIQNKARSAAQNSRALHDNLVSTQRNRAESAARLDIVGRAVSTGQAPILSELIDHADVYEVNDEILLDEVSDELVDNMKIALLDGSANDISRAWSSVSQMESSLGDLYPSTRLKLAEARQEATALAAQQDSAKFLELGRDSVATNVSKEEASVFLNNAAVDAYNNRLGTTHAVDNLDEITPDNELGVLYKKELQKSLNTAVSEVNDSIDTATEALNTIQNKEQATSSMVRSVLNLEPEEWTGVVDKLQEGVVSSEVDPVLIDESIDLLERSKTDPAARSEVMSQVFADSIHYGDVFDTLVGDNLKTQNLSQNGLREVIAFVGSDVKRVGALIGNEEQVYALSRTIEASVNDPQLDLVSEYQNHLATVQSVQFDTGKDTASFIPFLQTQKFAEEFHGNKDVRMSSQDLRTMLSVVNISSIDSDDPAVVSTVVKQQLSNAGFSVIRNDLLRISPARLSSNPTVPEAVGLDKDTLSKNLNTRNSTLSRYLGTKVGEVNKDLHDIALEKIQDSPTLVQGTGLSSTITKDMLFGMVEQGRVSFYTDSTKADASGTPIFMLLSDDSGRPVRPVRLMTIDFRDPIIVGTASTQRTSRPSSLTGAGTPRDPAFGF